MVIVMEKDAHEEMIEKIIERLDEQGFSLCAFHVRFNEFAGDPLQRTNHITNAEYL